MIVVFHLYYPVLLGIVLRQQFLATIGTNIPDRAGESIRRRKIRKREVCIMDSFFIAGTDTGVGKTVLSLILMQYLYHCGSNPIYIKPIQTGCRDPYDKDSDAKFIYDHVKELQGKDCASSVICCFREPKAPYFAARNEGKEIDSHELLQEICKRGEGHSHMIIEGAGGLFVPLTKTMLMIDLIRETRAIPVVAGRAALGTINHVLMSFETLCHRHLTPRGIVLIDSQSPPTDTVMIRENQEAIEAFSHLPIAGVIPSIADFAKPLDFFFPICERLLGNS